MHGGVQVCTSMLGSAVFEGGVVKTFSGDALENGVEPEGFGGGPVNRLFVKRVGEVNPFALGGWMVAPAGKE